MYLRVNDPNIIRNFLISDLLAMHVLCTDNDMTISILLVRSKKKYVEYTYICSKTSPRDGYTKIVMVFY